MSIQRLFFAIWPDDAFCEALLQRCKPWLRNTNGRPVVRENLHITLAFMGNVDEAQQECLLQMAGTIQTPAFTLNLNRLAFWPRPRVVWAGSSDTPEAFTQLARTLQEGARECDLQIDTRPPVAHLTLKRKVNKAPPGADFEPTIWDVERFYLVASKTFSEGVVYERLRSWPMR